LPYQRFVPKCRGSVPEPNDNGATSMDTKPAVDRTNVIAYRVLGSTEASRRSRWRRNQLAQPDEGSCAAETALAHAIVRAEV
jgi:hypothetical protein